MRTTESGDLILSTNELIAGDHDSLLLFGSEAQRELREFSNSMAKLLMNDNSDLDGIIRDMTDEINGFQRSINEKPMFSFMMNASKKREMLIK